MALRHDNLKAAWLTLASLRRSFQQEGMAGAWMLILLILLLALACAFLSYVPIVSPLIYTFF